MKRYVITKEECERHIKGICEGCGGQLSAIETVDNANNPTYWQGCEHCCCFRAGVELKYFNVARRLVQEGIIIPYDHLRRTEDEHWIEMQTASLSRDVVYIDKLLREYNDKDKP